MIEVLYMVQLARTPIQAMARRLFCRGVHHVTKGGYQSREGRDSKD